MDNVSKLSQFFCQFTKDSFTFKASKYPKKTHKDKMYRLFGRCINHMRTQCKFDMSAN